MVAKQFSARKTSFLKQPEVSLKIKGIPSDQMKVSERRTEPKKILN